MWLLNRRNALQGEYTLTQERDNGAQRGTSLGEGQVRHLSLTSFPESRCVRQESLTYDNFDVVVLSGPTGGEAGGSCRSGIRA